MLTCVAGFAADEATLLSGLGGSLQPDFLVQVVGEVEVEGVFLLSFAFLLLS